MATRLIIEDNSIYEIDEECEKARIKKKITVEGMEELRETPHTEDNKAKNSL